MTPKPLTIALYFSSALSTFLLTSIEFIGAWVNTDPDVQTQLPASQDEFEYPVQFVRIGNTR